MYSCCNELKSVQEKTLLKYGVRNVPVKSGNVAQQWHEFVYQYTVDRFCWPRLILIGMRHSPRELLKVRKSDQGEQKLVPISM